MSQAGLIDIEGSHPQIPTQFDANVGFAIPINNVLEVLGDNGITTEGSGNTITISLTGGLPIEEVGVDTFTAPGTNPVLPDSNGKITVTGSQVSTGTIGNNVIQTNSLSANHYTIQVQRSTSNATSDQTKNGVSHYDSAKFTVDSNGFVSINGSGLSETITGQSGGALSPTAGNWNIFGSSSVAGTSPVTTSGSVSTLTVNVQKSQAIAASDATKIGLSNFDSAAFDVDANGFVQLNGGGIAATSFDVQANTAPGTDPVVPTAAGVVIVNGAAVANHSVVLETRSRAANAYNLEVQYSAAAAATDATKSGVAHFDSSSFSVDANGFVTLAGGGEAIDSIGVDATSGGGTNPVLPTAAGLVTVNGARVAAGTNPIRSVSTAANVYQVQVQTSQAIASADATKVGLANFSSANFSVDSNGFVTLLNPSGFPWTDVTGATQTLAIDNGYITDRGAGVTYTLPSTAAIGDTIKIVGKLGLATITPNANQQILIGSSSAAVGITGTAVSNNVGDCIDLVCITAGASTVWRANSVVGTWTLTT